MEDQELRRGLDAVRERVGELKIREAWFLLAMGRCAAAVETAEAARLAAAGPTVPLGALRDPLREVTLVTCAARIGLREYVAADTAADRYIDLFGRDPETARLRELARWGRGTLGPIMVWQEVTDPEKELAAFDPAAYGRENLARLGAGPEAAAGPGAVAGPGEAPAPEVAAGPGAAAAPEAPADPEARVDPETPVGLRPVEEAVVPFYAGRRGRLPVDEDALRAELAAVPDVTGERAWAPHVRRAWLLIALGRYEAALAEVESARREFYGFRGLPADRHFAEALFEEGCEAELVADIALERWADAADAGTRGLADHGGEQRNLPLVRLVAVARGTVGRDWDTWRRQLTAFDPVQYALHRLRRD